MTAYNDEHENEYDLRHPKPTGLRETLDPKALESAQTAFVVALGSKGRHYTPGEAVACAVEAYLAALSASMAGPVPEPKGWVFQDTIDPTRQPLYTEDAYVASVWRNAHGTVTAVYAAPAPALPEVKPVAWRYRSDYDNRWEVWPAEAWESDHGKMQAARHPEAEPLYASAVQVEREGVDGEATRKAIIAFEDFLNEPPEFEDRYMVREYRHQAYREWEKLRALIAQQAKP